MSNGVPLQSAWIAITHTKALPAEVIAAHTRAASSLKWQYDPVLHCDIHFLVRPVNRGFALNAEMTDLLELFEDAGREIVPYSTDTTLKDRRASFLKDAWQENLIYRPWLRLDAEKRKKPSERPAELIICDELLMNKTPVSQDSHVTIHTGYSYVSS